eukprot:SAG31_NODE_883_length_11260_cov_38.912284_1_plen_195_part_00
MQPDRRNNVAKVTISPFLEQTHPEIINAMVAVAMRGYDVKDDGTLVSKLSKMTTWNGSPPPAIVRTYGCGYQAIATSKQAMLWPVQLVVKITSAWAAIMPEAVLGVIGSDPSSEYAVQYRRFVRVTMLPGLRSRDAPVAECGGSAIEGRYAAGRRASRPPRRPRARSDTQPNTAKTTTVQTKTTLTTLTTATLH